MTRLFEVTSSGLIIRDPTSGDVLLDSGDRMLAKIGELSVTGVTLEWPKVPGEAENCIFSGGGISCRHTVPAYENTSPVVIGAHTGPLPHIIWARVKLTRTVAGRFDSGIDEQSHPYADGMWVQMPGGSLMIERGAYQSGGNKATWLWRHIDFAVSTGDWVVNKRQSNIAYTSPYRSLHNGNTRSVYTMDAVITWANLDG